MKQFLSVLALLLLLMPVAMAQDTVLPDMPKPIQALSDRGAQVRYLGKSHNMDGWIAIFQGQEQYFYVLPDGGFLTGLLFDKEGRSITVQQVQELQAQEGDVLDMFADVAAPGQESVADAFKVQTPAERMFDDVSHSNWIPLGSEAAPVIYSFVDPQCGHCHAFLKDLKEDYIESGRLQVRLVPVGFKEESIAQAAFLLAAANPQERWFAHLDGDKGALPAKNDISTQGIERNMAVMGAWKFDVTPMSVYRTRSGEIKLIRGRAKDIEKIITDLAS